MKPYQQFLKMWALPRPAASAQPGDNDAVEKYLLPDNWPNASCEIPAKRAGLPAESVHLC
jgi:hypothetical protein